MIFITSLVNWFFSIAPASRLGPSTKANYRSVDFVVSLSLTLNIDRFVFDQINIVTERRFDLTLNRSVVVGARQHSLKFDSSSKVLPVEKFVRLFHFGWIKPCGNKQIQSR